MNSEQSKANSKPVVYDIFSPQKPVVEITLNSLAERGNVGIF